MTTKAFVFEFFSAESEEGCKKALYRNTDCGAWIEFTNHGIELGSIVEGADFGTAIYPLNYCDNFGFKDIQERIDAIEAEADALWNWANEVDDNEQTQMELGVDAPDVDFEYRHLNPMGRSA